MDMEETMRTQTLWLKEGGSNSKYFHCIASQCRRKNKIAMIQMDGTIHQSQEYIAGAFTSFYHRLVRTHPERHSFIDMNWRDLYPPQEWGEPVIEKPFSKEIRMTVFDLAVDKALGPDGFNMRSFFKLFKISFALTSWISLMPSLTTILTFLVLTWLSLLLSATRELCGENSETPSRAERLRRHSGNKP